MLYFTQIIYGRAQTAAESQQLKTYCDDPAVSAVYIPVGSSVISPTEGAPYHDLYVGCWSSETAADGYLALVNGFTPPPQTAKKLS